MDEYLKADLRRARRDVAVAQQRRDEQVQAIAGLTGDAAALAFARRVLIEREQTLRLTELSLAVIVHMAEDRGDAPSRAVAPTTGSSTTSTTTS